MSIPRHLQTGPVTVSQAADAGISWDQLQGESWRRIGFGIYTSARRSLEPQVLLAAAAGRLPPEAVFAGKTAAWLHGLDVPPCDPIEVIVPYGCGVSGRRDLRLRRGTIAADEIVVRGGFRTSWIVGTLVDVAHRVPLVEAVVVADEALHRRLLTLERLQRHAARIEGKWGSAAIRKVVGFAEPKAESPMETRIRMVLVLNGLPRPEAQPRLHDRWGRFLGRPDLYYREPGVAIEYDGGTHRESLVEDNRRQNRLTNAGIQILRFTYADVMGNPSGVVATVARALQERQAAA